MSADELPRSLPAELEHEDNDLQEWAFIAVSIFLCCPFIGSVFKMMSFHYSFL